ncbi:MAG: hypothetical protein HQ581_01820 [Planctomycetes bacterium]|nr:hypothetical protein [Planctomycetota bacterium]
MSVISGKDGTLYLGEDEVTPVTNWRLVKTSDNKNYAANDTGGAKKRVAGVKDCSGTLEIKADDTANVPVEEGDAVALKLHVDDTGNNYYDVPAMIDRIEVDVDIDRGEIVAYFVAFSGNGTITANGILSTTGGSGSGS